MYLKKIAGEAPKEPGVYLFRNAENAIIYIGKARILRNRLTSYFSGEKDIKTKILLQHAASIETIIVKDEYEALLLENTLIKQHNPKYNISLKDGKTYPLIRLTSGPFPRIFKTRHIIEDGSGYYGPFTDVGALNDLLDIVDRVFLMRKCRTLRKRSNPCMYYHIGRCAAPCCGKISQADYSRQVEQIQKLLNGDTAALIAELTAEMKEEAAALRFERAAQIRNAVKFIESLGESSAVVDFDPHNRDYISWAAEGVFAAYSVFSMREGKLTGRDLFFTCSAAEEEESLVTFITTYYDNSRLPPPKIFLQTLNLNSFSQRYSDTKDMEKDIFNNNSVPPCLCEINSGKNLLLNWFKEQFDFEPELLAATEKHHDAILAMARLNAQEELRRRLRERGAGPALDQLQKLLGLKKHPKRIEGFDISQLAGKYPVASLVSFMEGKPEKKNYRHFKLRSVIGVVDDYAAIREAVKRHYNRLLRENRDVPDLILIDGGIGQVNAAKGILDQLGLHCDLAGLAKREEEIWLPGAKVPLELPRSSDALKLLQFVRNESHRFATRLNQKLRRTDLQLYTLESVEGIGPKRAAVLIRHYKNIEAIAEADIEDIAQVGGCGSAAANAVRAAAKLALTERKTRDFPAVSRNKTGKSRTANLAANLADEALGQVAAEKDAEYE